MQYCDRAVLDRAVLRGQVFRPMNKTAAPRVSSVTFGQARSSRDGVARVETVTGSGMQEFPGKRRLVVMRRRRRPCPMASRTRRSQA